jgi:hypothetical protein
MQISNYSETAVKNIMLHSHLQEDNTASKKRKTVSPEQLKKVVDYAFAEILPLYPYWKSTIEDGKKLGELKRAWAKAFAANGIFTNEQVNIGLRKLYQKDLDFIPSAIRFASLCKPEEVSPQSLGLPDYLNAFRYACTYVHNFTYGYLANDKTNEVIKLAVQNAGISLILEGTEAARKRFDYEYSNLIQKIASGEDVTSSVAPLPSPKEATYARTDSDVDFAKKAMKSIKNLLS